MDILQLKTKISKNLMSKSSFLARYSLINQSCRGNIKGEDLKGADARKKHAETRKEESHFTLSRMLPRAFLSYHMCLVASYVQSHFSHKTCVSHQLLACLTGQRFIIEPFTLVFQISGSARNIEPEFLGNLIRGLVYLQVRSEEVPQGELRSQVFLNEDSCSKRLPPRGQNELRGSCHFGDKIYSDGEKWVSEDDKCTSCTCEVPWYEIETSILEINVISLGKY